MRSTRERAGAGVSPAPHRYRRLERYPLVDFATKAKDDYDDLDEAVIATGQTRLRLILMAAFATIFALLPLALGLAGGGSELVSSSLALTVIGGLTTSTSLTLLVVPVGYSLLEGARSRRKKRR